MEQPAHTIAQHSYSRCLRAPGFFDSLYERLLAADPVIASMFAGTEFPRQHKVLQHGLGLLLSYANKPDPALLERIAARHSAGGVDVPPDMYRHFVDALLHAVRVSDPSFDDRIETAWKEAIEPGIEFMKDRYRV